MKKPPRLGKKINLTFFFVFLNILFTLLGGTLIPCAWLVTFTLKINVKRLAEIEHDYIPIEKRLLIRNCKYRGLRLFHISFPIPKTFYLSFYLTAKNENWKNEHLKAFQKIKWENGQDTWKICARSHAKIEQYFHNHFF